MEQMMKKTAHLDAEFDKEFPDRNLDKEKNDIINSIKKYRKEDLITKPEKYTIWKRITKALGF
jgi:hypothetical protein